ncbi:MAG: response regulator [Halobellus sp.]|uniref:response regulator n=1 Tax=Halobellus sp. TaxID=1979212 RepID=UPI0035D460E5
MSDDRRPRVLAVDDEPNVARAYAIYLKEDYDVETATDGEEALAAVDDSFEVVLLDRRMPDLRGDEVLRRLRERGYDGQVALVTAVDPQLDALDLDFEMYLTKPVTKADLVEAVDRLVEVSRCGNALREQFRLAQMRAAVESGANPSKLEASEEYSALLERLSELTEQTDGIAELADEETLAAATQDLPDDPGE